MPTCMFMIDAFNRLDGDSRNHKFKQNRRKELKVSHYRKIKVIRT